MLHFYRMCCSLNVCVALLPDVSLTRFGECAVARIHRQRRPTQVNEGQRRPTKTKKGPNDDRYVFFMYNHFILFYNESSSRKSFFYYYYEAQEGPQQLTTANKGQRRPTKTKKGPNDDRYVFFMYK